jgi:hypothetical protein
VIAREVLLPRHIDENIETEAKGREADEKVAEAAPAAA